MQVIAPVGNADLLAPGQRPLMRLEIYDPVATAWRDISKLGTNPVAPTVAPFKNYLKDISFTSGGARMTPDPIAGQFSATISNEGNIFHPNHPTSAPYNTYFRAGTLVRISLGGNYTGVVPPIKYWPRIIGYMDQPEFSSDIYELTIKGLDYMKVLSDMKFTKEVSTYVPTPIDNYWGALHNVPSLPTVPPGVELYVPASPPGDAGATFASGSEGWDVVTYWVAGVGAPVKTAVAGVVSAVEIKFDTITNPRDSIIYNNVCNVGVGLQYTCTFRYARTAGTAGSGKHLRLTLYSVATGNIVGGSGFLDPPTNFPASGAYETCSFTFTPSAADAGWLDLKMVGRCFGNAMTWRVDEISIQATPPPATEVYYAMPALCTGIYHVVLDGVEQWPGKQKGEGWYYDLGTNRFWFDIDKIVAAGVGNNLFIYYYTAHALENVVADILVKAFPTIYGAVFPANRNAALAAMSGPATGVNVDRIRFVAGSTYINAIRMICERCNYRFYFDWGGIPKFVIAPTPGVPPPVFTTFLPQHFTSPKLYQDRSEIWNRIVIEGEKVAELVGWEDNMPSELKDEANNPASIALYGENTKSIKNILFQSIGDITAMCATLLAAYKDPKWYFDFETPYNAVPLVLGDTVQVQELLNIVGPINVTHTCLIRNADVSRYNVTYRCEI